MGGVEIWKTGNFLLALCQGPVARDQNLMLAWGWVLQTACEALRGNKSKLTLTRHVDSPEADLPAFLVG